MNDELDNANDTGTEPVDTAGSDDGIASQIVGEHEPREEVEVQEPTVEIESSNDTVIESEERPSADGHFTDVTLLDKLSEENTFYSSNGGETQAVEDYTDVLNDIGQLLTYSNTLLLVILVFVVLFMGLFSGHVLTNWFRNRQ